MSTLSPTFSLKTLIEHFMHSFFTGLQGVLTPCFTIIRAKNNNFSFHATERPKMWHFNDHRSGRKFMYKNGLFYMPQKNKNNILYNFKTKIIFICCSDTHALLHAHMCTERHAQENYLLLALQLIPVMKKLYQILQHNYFCYLTLVTRWKEGWSQSKHCENKVHICACLSNIMQYKIRA